MNRIIPVWDLAVVNSDGAAGEKEDSIYRMSINGKNLKRLIKNARFPSVSAPQA